MERLIADIHTHILPGMDDGPDNVETSIQMLRCIKNSGISSVILTPHFYPHKEDPESFQSRRCESVKTLLDEIERSENGDFPDLYLGAEAAYYKGISRSSSIKKLSVCGSSFILVEMPFSRWGNGEIKDLSEIREHLGLIPIVAHIERYEKFQKHDTVYKLMELGVLFQINSEYLLNEKTRKKAMEMICSGKVQFIASDCHNMNDRAPTLAGAIELVKKEISPEFLDDFSRLSRFVIKKASKLN